MTTGAELPCPKCGRELEALSWHDERGGRCWSCRTPFEFIGFPALRARRPGAVPKAVLVAEHATCFHHPENQAEVVCEGCGRFLCSVCAIHFGRRLVCPACIKAATTTDADAVGSRLLFDGIALALAVLPLLMWPTTVVTAPVALGAAVVGWRKPRSLVEPGRSRLVVAGLIALAEIAGWVTLLVVIWLKKKR